MAAKVKAPGFFLKQMDKCNLAWSEILCRPPQEHVLTVTGKNPMGLNRTVLYVSIRQPVCSCSRESLCVDEWYCLCHGLHVGHTQHGACDTIWTTSSLSMLSIQSTLTSTGIEMTSALVCGLLLYNQYNRRDMLCLREGEEKPIQPTTAEQMGNSCTCLKYTMGYMKGVKAFTVSCS